MASRGFEDGWWQSPDGLKLHYRDYPGHHAGRPPILCVPGLTRNARDFEELAARLSPEWRLICVDLRGRGESERAADSADYQPPVYLADLDALLAELAIDRLVWFGTSLGGLLAAGWAATHPGRLAGVLLNDIGPVLEPAGMTRIRSYLGKSISCPTWLHAARTIADGQRDIFPRYELADWLAMAKRVCRLTSAGRIVYDYDMRIAEPMRATADAETAPDLWPTFEALAGIPALLVRGERSDLLSAATAHQMVQLLPPLQLVTVADVGHVPTLCEPVAAAAIDRLLARIG